jgi:hypothetical protein
MASSRYAIHDLLELRGNINTEPFLDQVILGELLRRYATEETHFPRGQTLSPRRLPVLACIDSFGASDVGRILIDLDVELRRTLAFVTDGTMRPYPDRQAVEVLTTQSDSMTNVLLSLAPSFFGALTNEPLEFLLAFSWFWDHRINQTRTRPAKSLQEQFNVINEINDCAKRSVILKKPVMTTLKIDKKGFTEICLDSTWTGFVEESQ